MKYEDLADIMADSISKFPKVSARYKYDGENSINPAYCDIEHCLPVCTGEKRIWLLRGDLTLAVGIKNANVSKGNTRLLDKIAPSMHKYINLDDRYGHPSLAIPEKGYDGSAYYAGWFRQDANHIHVFICSGRYHNSKLVTLHKRFLESWISLKLIAAFGKQPIIFNDWAREDELDVFIRGNSFSLDKPKRIYSQTSAQMDGLLLLFLLSLDGEKPLSRYKVLLGLAAGIVLALALEELNNVFQFSIARIFRYIMSVLIDNIDNNEKHSMFNNKRHDIQLDPVAKNLINVSIFKFKDEIKPEHNRYKNNYNELKCIQ